MMLFRARSIESGSSSTRLWCCLVVGLAHLTGPLLPATDAASCGAFVAAIASADDGNVPANAIDGNLSTRWSADGVGSWIRADLGAARPVSAVRIAWYRGDERNTSFVISLSSDGLSFSDVFAGTSSGTTVDFEMYAFGVSNARYVKVTVNGNTQNDWASISELEVRDFASVSAIGDDGNVPANAIDGDLSTRWSHNGLGSWIQGDLGAVLPVSAVRIAWYRGDERTTSFVIEVSADGTSYATVVSATSSGTTLDFETYAFAETSARYVKVTVNGNSQNTWASISELTAACGSSGGGTPPGTDPNGTTQIYGTRTGTTTDPAAAPWTLGHGDWESRIRSFGTVSGSGSNTVVRQSGQTRMTVKATTSTCEGLRDHGLALQQGYMCSEADWTNVEMTGYFKLNSPASSASDQDWTVYGNGGRHTGNGTVDGCLGSAYKASYHYKNADHRMAKESYHVNYDYKAWQNAAGGIDYTANQSAWLGMKLVRYQFTRGGQPRVRLELWLDFGGIDANGAPANQWQLHRAAEDHPDQPSWGENAGFCDAPVGDQIMFWGGPWVTWRWDNTDSSLRLMSVREIVPSQ